METREQENQIERLALEHGRVCVRNHYVDHVVRATVPSGAHFFINPAGKLRQSDKGDWSVNWSQE